MPINYVMTADTGMEFPDMYEHLQKVDEYLHRERGLHITMLKHSQSFEYLMFEQPKISASALAKRKSLGLPPYGNGWPGIKVRWCCGHLKTHLVEQELKLIAQGRKFVQYIGIVADEDARLYAQLCVVAYIHTHDLRIYINGAHDLCALLVKVAQDIFAHLAAAVLYHFNLAHNENLLLDGQSVFL